MLLSNVLVYAQASGDSALIQCTTKYALCIASDCPKNEDGTTASCKCPIYEGENWGETTCAERVRTSKTQIYSEYSPRYLLTSKGSSAASKMLFEPDKLCDINSEGSAPATYSYADCFDVLCTVAPGGKEALCNCPVTTSTVSGSGEQGGVMLEANNCAEANAICNNFASSSSPIAVNSAPAAFGGHVINTALRAYGEHPSPSMTCAKDDLKKDILESKKALKGDSGKEILKDDRTKPLLQEIDNIKQNKEPQLPERSGTNRINQMKQ